MEAILVTMVLIFTLPPDKGPSKHDVLFFYGGHAPGHGGPAAARYGSFKGWALLFHHGWKWGLWSGL